MTSLLQGTVFKLANYPCAILQLFSHPFIDDVRELYVNKRGEKSKKKKDSVAVFLYRFAKINHSLATFLLGVVLFAVAVDQKSKNNERTQKEANYAREKKRNPSVSQQGSRNASFGSAKVRGTLSFWHGTPA